MYSILIQLLYFSQINALYSLFNYVIKHDVNIPSSSILSHQHWNFSFGLKMWL